MWSTNLPVAALTVIGALLAVIGLFIAASIQVVIVGLVAMGWAGLLQVLDRRGR